MEKVTVIISFAIMWISLSVGAQQKSNGESINVNGNDVGVIAVAKIMLYRAFDLGLIVGQNKTQSNWTKEMLVEPFNIRGTKQLVKGEIYNLTFDGHFKGWVGAISECHARLVLGLETQGGAEFLEEPKCKVKVVRTKPE